MRFDAVGLHEVRLVLPAKAFQLRERCQIEAAGLRHRNERNAVVRGSSDKGIRRVFGAFANKREQREIDLIPATLRKVQGYSGRCGNKLRLD